MSNYHIGQWNQLLQNNNTEKLWRELYRIVSKHALAKQFIKREGLVDAGKYNYYTDLTQDLFVQLLEKDRFNSYISNEMSDVEIEFEISQLELSNMMTLDLRKRYPERFRMARRISTILKNSKCFLKYNDSPNKRSVNKQFILREWQHRDNESVDGENVRDLIKDIPSVIRNNKIVGCSADTQLIISNNDLESFMILVFSAVDRAMSIKQVREAVMSKLTLLDIDVVRVEDYNTNEDDREFELEDRRPNPEDAYLSKEFNSKINSIVDDFVWTLSVKVKHKKKQYRTILKVLNLYYFGDKLNQYEVSKVLQVSDSLVNYYRRQIESILQELKFTLKEAKLFEQVLRKRVEQELSFNSEE